MQISITGHHLDVTEALKNFIHDKFKKLQRHFEDIHNAHVILTVEKLVQKAEAKLNVRGAEIFAVSSSEDMYAAIDALVDKLDRQLLKHKEKTATH